MFSMIVTVLQAGVQDWSETMSEINQTPVIFMFPISSDALLIPYHTITIA